METCVCAAILCIGKIFRGHRHTHALQAMNDEFSWKMSREKIMGLEQVQGFLTTGNRFVTREEGRKLQDAAGIKSVAKGGYRADSLYSEDLY